MAGEPDAFLTLCHLADGRPDLCHFGKKLDCAIAITRRRQVECCIPTVGMDFVSVCFCILFKGSKHCEAELLAQNLHLLPLRGYLL